MTPDRQSAVAAARFRWRFTRRGLTAPEAMIRLVTQRGWIWESYQAWLAKAMAHSVLGRRRLAPDR